MHAKRGQAINGDLVDPVLRLVKDGEQTGRVAPTWRQWLEGLIGLGPLVPLLMPLLLGVGFVFIEILLNFLSDPPAGLRFPIEWVLTLEGAWCVGGLLGAWALASAIFLEESIAQSRILAIGALMGLLAGLTVGVHWLYELGANATGHMNHPYGWSWNTLALVVTGPMVIGGFRAVRIARRLLMRGPRH